MEQQTESKKTVAQLHRLHWVITYAAIAAAMAVVVCWGSIPLAKHAMREGKMIAAGFQKRLDADSFPQQEVRMRREREQLTALLEQLDVKQQHEGKVVDRLYNYAEKAGFRSEKIEVGLPQMVAGSKETAIALSGTGTFTAFGKLLEQVENSGQATRVRQFVAKRAETGDPELFLEVVVIEPLQQQAAEAGRSSR